MNRRKLSLSFKVNLLMTVMILAVSAVLLFISNTYYWETVYDPHIRKLSQFSISNNEIAEEGQIPCPRF
ncbi:MAG: hypothetical protein IKE24_01180 [Clostridia bacterium]|nr:hypothetical protein [Clostridia bacterium]